MGTEFELKFAAKDAAVLEDILKFMGRPAEKIQMATTYYDTSAGALSRRKWTLRLRKENDASVVTFKTAGDGKTRGEWEYEAETLEGSAEKLILLGAPEELADILASGVQPVCGAEFLRRAIRLETDGAALEVALDFGRLFRGNRELPICEVEVELKSGEEAAVREFAGELAERFGLKEEAKSKFVRAVSL